MDNFPDTGPDYRKLLHEQQERLKELACINQTTAILREGKPVEDTLQQLVLLLPPAWQYPDYTSARIRYQGKSYETGDFAETPWCMSQDFTSIDGLTGEIQVFYTEEFRTEDEGPFLREERNLIRNIASLLTGYINSLKASDLYRQSKTPAAEEEEKGEITSRKLLQRFLDRNNADRDVFYDLQPFRVKEIMLVANLYDAYSIEGEGRFAEHLLGEFYQLSVTTMPRITGVSGEEEAIKRIRSRHYDMIIIMIGVDRDLPLRICARIREAYPYLPVFLLLSNTADIPFVMKKRDEGLKFDNCFVWTGESKVFYAMVRLLEDRVNADNDTKKGLTRVIVIAEDSPGYYSGYLPVLYDIVMEQTKSLVGDVSDNDLLKVMKLRARPKILLASTYEDAVILCNKYKEYLLCLITDMRFPRGGQMDDLAGFALIRHMREELPDLPAILQSSDPANASYAHKLKSSFINKNSGSMMKDLKAFITYYLGFGHFIYRDNKGKQIAVARSLKEFESYLDTIPEESLVYHATKNHFSLWLMARGEVSIARMINPMRVSDFRDLEQMRRFLVELIRKRRRETNRGKVVNFEESAAIDETNVVSLAGGSPGGKGRGLAFLNTLIYSFELGRLIPGINIKTPVTAIIGTDEFDMFMERNHIREKIKDETDFRIIRKHFAEGSLSYSLQKELRVLLRLLNKPLAIRSSSLFEDSTSQPFSGIFVTCMLPNNHQVFDTRLKQAENAIKLVFASIYSRKSISCFEAVGFSPEQEKMAVVVQEVVGNRFENVYYPHISGTAQSYNFYPVAHMAPEEGFAVLATGLGQYVVEGRKAFMFSPAWPSTDIVSQKDLYLNSQVHFYAIDMTMREIDLLEGENAGLVSQDISDAERHGTLKHCGSVYNPDNDSIIPGLDSSGPRVINFADILKFGYIPLANAIRITLDIIKEAFGTPVEIEFAVDLAKDSAGNASLYLLQIKPLTGNSAGYDITPENIQEENLLVLSAKSMGNGLVDDISDVIFVDPSRFDAKFTEEMAAEAEKLNDEMVREKRKYLLIGPGRWGTSDRFAGIPVTWPQISNARAIVEVSLPDLPVIASLGSHFFHNVTAMKIGYLSVNLLSGTDTVVWEELNRQETVKDMKFFRHVRFKAPLLIRMDGKKGIAVITTNH